MTVGIVIHWVFVRVLRSMKSSFAVGRLGQTIVSCGTLCRSHFGRKLHEKHGLR